MTSIYTTYADHNATEISRRARAARAAGEGMGWGREDDTLEAAAADMGATVLHSTGEGLLCELSDRLYLLGDVNGPWAVEVATQADLLDGETITHADIRYLSDRAGEAGDLEQVAICERALDGSATDRAECARVLREMRTDD